ncbi:hypothetical protein C8E97_4532 [Saccharothrix australiensis]|uniref:Secreted protein n=2 Tax=Saccharothrix australiensis TaxID=2072 RepID=A0A495W3C5_9PSEU|nr:hypothetical protein C8E97_4532 [Saccharothrix australiensis]
MRKTSLPSVAVAVALALTSTATAVTAGEAHPTDDAKWEKLYRAEKGETITSLAITGCVSKVDPVKRKFSATVTVTTKDQTPPTGNCVTARIKSVPTGFADIPSGSATGGGNTAGGVAADENFSPKTYDDLDPADPPEGKLAACKDGKLPPDGRRSDYPIPVNLILWLAGKKVQAQESTDQRLSADCSEITPLKLPTPAS